MLLVHRPTLGWWGFPKCKSTIVIQYGDCFQGSTCTESLEGQRGVSNLDWGGFREQVTF